MAAQTFAHELEVMNAIFHFAVERGLILTNPAVSIRRKRITPAKIDIPTREQFKKLVAQIRFSDGRNDSQEKAKDGADLVEFLAYSGARLGEAVAGDVHYGVLFVIGLELFALTFAVNLIADLVVKGIRGDRGT